VTDDLVRLAVETPRAELPALLGRLAQAEATARLRLLEAPPPVSAETRLLDATAAAAIAGCSERWLRSHTRGLPFRRDLSRKNARFDEAGLRVWLARRRT
jgi:hypothetical protein